MKFMFTGLTAAVFCAGQAFAAVENVLSMQREASGTYSVVCDNKGVVSHSAGVTADLIRGDQVCGHDFGVVQLEDGLYHTQTDFCSQTVQWSGPQLQLILDAPCAGTLTLDSLQSNWYRGKLAGYEYIYEVQVQGPGNYIFYSRDFGTQGDFVKANGAPSKNPKAKRHADPARN